MIFITRLDTDYNYGNCLVQSIEATVIFYNRKSNSFGAIASQSVCVNDHAIVSAGNF